MLFSVAAIQGHFSITLLLFMTPQVFNFVYSTPQLFHLIPCPRHRMPKLNKNGLITCSIADIHSQNCSWIGFGIIKALASIGLVKCEYKEGKIVSISNLTLINLILVLFGDMREDFITVYVIGIQCLASVATWIFLYVVSL